MAQIVDNTKVYDVTEVLDKFGKYQVIQYALICLPALFVTMISINYVFVAGDVSYRCRIPECEGAESSAEMPPWWPTTAIDKCTKPVLKDHSTSSICTEHSFSESIEKCTEWIYENNSTVIAELNLACQPWKSSLIGTIHSFGMLFSMVISGWMSDRFGRKPTLIFCVVGSCIGNLKTFAKSYYLYVTIEFLEASVSAGSYAAAMVIMLEIVGHKYRLLSGVVFAYAIYLGECIYACIAMFVPYWKTIIRIINGPSLLFISYIFLINESPRWQILNGKTEEAKNTLLRVTKINKININRHELKNISEAKLKEKFNIEEHGDREGFRAIVKSKVILVRLLVASVCRFTASFVYYGLMINSVWLPGDKYTNFLLATVMSFPGELIALYLMSRIGRKLPMIVGFVMCGGLCVASGCVPASCTWAKITLFLVGKMLISGCFTGAITYTMELFPTSARGSLLGVGAFASRVGGMLAPLTPLLNTVSETLPSIFFGLSAVLAGILLTLTPETRDLPLMDTVQQVEHSVRSAGQVASNTVHKCCDHSVCNKETGV